MERFVVFIVTFVVAFGIIGIPVDGLPYLNTVRLTRSSRLVASANNFTLAPNLDYQWVTHIRKAPALMSFHDEDDGIEIPHIFVDLIKTVEKNMMCPLFLELDLPDENPHKNRTAVLFSDEDAEGITVVLTDNKTYFVGAGSKSGGKIVTVFKLVDPLAAVEEKKIKEMLEELKYKVKPTSFIRKEDCIAWGILQQNILSYLQS